MSQEWYVRRGNHEQGPYTPQELKQLAESGNLTHSTWLQAGTVKGLFSGTDQEQPVPPPISPISSDAVSKVDGAQKFSREVSNELSTLKRHGNQQRPSRVASIATLKWIRKSPDHQRRK